MIENLCQRYSCRPSEIMEEDADLIFHNLALLNEAGEGGPKEVSPEQSMEASLAGTSKPLNLKGEPI